MKKHGAVFLLQSRQLLFSLRFIGGQKSFKAETGGGKTRQGQGVNAGATAGNTGDRNAPLGAQCDQILARIGDGGRSRIGDQGAGLPVLEAFDDLRAALAAVVLVIRDHWLGDAEISEQTGGIAGIFCRNKVNAGQHFDGAQRKIVQVSDGSGNQIQRGWLDAVFVFAFKRGKSDGGDVVEKSVKAHENNLLSL